VHQVVGDHTLTVHGNAEWISIHVGDHGFRLHILNFTGDQCLAILQLCFPLGGIFGGIGGSEVVGDFKADFIAYAIELFKGLFNVFQESRVFGGVF